MASDVILSVYTKHNCNSNLITFQQEVMNRYLPKGMDFLQLDMESAMREMQEPPWAENHKVHKGEQFSSSFHAKCLDKCLYSLSYDHFIILDIDAVPLSPEFFDFMLSNRQWLIGTAHAANHLGNGEKFVPYTSPAAMSISKRTYCFLQESFAPDKLGMGFYDSGIWITVAAQKRGIPNVLLYPTDCLIPRWRVGWVKYGLITNYADLLCHMWASRAVGNQYYQQYIQFCEEHMQDTIPIEPLSSNGRILTRLVQKEL